MFHPELLKDLMIKVSTGAGGIHVYRNQTPREKRIIFLDHIVHFMHSKPLVSFWKSFVSVLDNA